MKAAAAELRFKKATVSLEETHTDKVRSLTLASDDATVTAAILVFRTRLKN